jgi:hypothetical protein
MSTIQILISDLWTASIDNSRKKLHFSNYDMTKNIYIKGKLAISCDGKIMPGLGYFGEDDVTLFEWLHYLNDVKNNLMGAYFSKYKLIVPEQSEPAYEFVREGDWMYSSIVACEETGGLANEHWQKVPCLFQDFEKALETAKSDLFQQIKKDAPNYVERIWSRKGNFN